MLARIRVRQFASWVYIGTDIFFPSVKYICSKCCLKYFEEITLTGSTWMVQLVSVTVFRNEHVLKYLSEPEESAGVRGARMSLL